jgi:hypothetical protein
MDSTIALGQTQHRADRSWGNIPIALNWCIYDEMLDFQKNSK